MCECEETPWLNNSLTMLHTLQSQNLVGVKEVLVKELGFIFEII
jgi:hypothetical protein